MIPNFKTAIKSLNEKNNNNYDALVNHPINNEAEYLEKCKYVIGEDENENAIYSATPLYSWSEINAEFNLLITAYNNKEYQRNRATAYPSIQEFAEAYCEKEIGGDSTKWNAYKTAYNKVRTDNPK